VSAAPLDPRRYRPRGVHLGAHWAQGAAPDTIVRAFADDRIVVIASPALLAELDA
jgi:hypothetical protein